MRKKLWIPTAAGGAALALVVTTGVATALHKNDVELVVDGVSSTIAVREDTVGEVMELENITLDEHDILLPSADTRVSDGMEITVAYGRPLTLTVDGKEREVWTTAQNVGDALAFLNLDTSDSKLSASRSTEIGRAGLTMEMATAQDVTVAVAGEPTKLSVAGTVADALTAAGVAPDADDIVTPAADTALTDGLEIAFVDVEVSSSTKNAAIPFTKTETPSAEMEKGTQKVTTKGVDGFKRETYSDVHHDGVLVSSTLQESVISQQPVQQVTTVGTKVVQKKAPAPAPAKTSTPEKAPAPAKASASEKAPAPAKVPAPAKAPAPAEAPASSPDSSESASTPAASSGKSLNTARSAMWDRIAACESGNDWSINTGNGYYGGLQFNAATWRSVNGQDFAALPHQASRAEQITVANRLYAVRGTQPWSCA